MQDFGGGFDDLLTATNSSLQRRVQQTKHRPPTQQEWQQHKQQQQVPRVVQAHQSAKRASEQKLAQRNKQGTRNNNNIGGKPPLKRSPSEKVSTFTVPSKSKSGKPSKKTASSSRKSKKKTDEVDDSRPDTEKKLFSPLQKAKINQRKAQQERQAKGGKMAETQQQSCSTRSGTADKENEQGNNNSDPRAVAQVPATSTPESTPPGTPPIQQEEQEERQVEGESSPGGQENAGSPASTTEFDMELKLCDDDGNPMNIDHLGDDVVVYQNLVMKKLKKNTDSDKKAGKDSRLTRLTKLRRQHANCMFRIWRLKNLHEVNAQLVAENVELKKKIAELMKGPVKKSKQMQQALTLQKCKDHEDKASQLAKTELWRTVKFVATVEEERENAEKVFEMMELDKEMWDDNRRASWCVTYAKLITKALNSQRNYLTAELKKVAWTLLTENKPLPTAEQILSCATRSCEDMVICKLYWDKILPKALGKDYWSEKQRYFQTISSVKSESGKKLASPPTEAMVVIIWENNLTKWPRLYKWSLEAENKGKKQPNLNGKWSITDGGHHERCAWSSDGLDTYNKYKKAIRKARGGNKNKPDSFDTAQEKKYLAWEDKVLAALRMDKGYAYATAEEEDRAKKVSEQYLVCLPMIFVLTLCFILC